MRFNNNNFRSLNESINFVQNPYQELDEALEYADTLESIILSICEELEIDPDELVEDVMTDSRLKELVKKRNTTAKKNQSYSTAADDRIRNRMEREAGSKKVYGRGGKVLKRKPKGKTHGFGSPAFERGQGWMGMQG